MTDHDEAPETDRAVCNICDGQKVDADGVKCWACLGTGHELTRDELLEGDDDAA